MRSKEVLVVFWTVVCSAQGVLITNIQDYCTKESGRQFQCKGLNFGSSTQVEFASNNKLDGDQLYFMDSKLFTIPKNAFRISKPVNIFSMKNCGLREIYRHNFESGGTSTQELHLPNNFLQRVPGRAFELLPKLRHLTLSHNNLTTLDADCFAGLANVVYLLLDNNKLRTLTHDILEPLRNLGHIYLQGNKLEYLPRTLFSNNKQLVLVHAYRNNLKILDINIVKNPVAVQYLLEHFSQPIEPTHIDIEDHPNLMYSDFSHNYFPYISRQSFPKATSLRTFIADNCQLTTIEYGAFSAQINLWNFYLPNNQLESFDLNQLSTMKKLKDIDFRSNKLKEFDYRLLADNKDLHKVSLAGNPLPCGLNNEIVHFFKNKSIAIDLKEIVCGKA